MLTVMRSKAGGIVAKIFIGLLAASFAVWGISDVFRGKRTDTLASVGDSEITVGQFQQTFRNQLNRLSRQLGKPITPDEARQMGMDRQVLASLIQNAAISEAAKRLKLALSDKFIADRIARMKEFQGLTGTFDVNKFRSMLANAGISEAQFLREEKQGLMRARLLAAIAAGVKAPKSEVKLVYLHRHGARDAQFFRIPASAVSVPDPTPEELKAFHDSHKALFALPERRQIAVLTALPQDLKARVKVTDDEIKAYYEAHKNAFGAPERRTVEQIVLANEEEAKKAAEDLKNNKTTWADLARAKGLSDADLKLGTFTRDNYPDPQLAKDIFSLKEGEISKPLKGALSVSLARVTKIEPGHTRSLDEVRNEIADKIKLEKAKDLALEIHDKVEDARAGGQSLDDIAKALKLKETITPYLAANGQDEKGKPVKLPAAADLLKAAFESGVGVDNDVIPTNDDGFVWFDVRDVKPATIQPLDKVRDKAVKLWKKQKLAELLLAKARELKKRAEAGADFAQLAQEAGGTVKTLTQIKRTDAREDFPTAAVRALFAAAENGYAVALDGDTALVIKSIPLAPPQMDEKSTEVRAIRQVLAQSISSDMTAQYLAALQKEFGVKINKAVWARITGNGQ